MNILYTERYPHFNPLFPLSSLLTLVIAQQSSSDAAREEPMDEPGPGVYGVIRCNGVETKVSIDLNDPTCYAHVENTCLPPEVKVLNQTLAQLAQAVAAARQRSDEVFSVEVEAVRAAEAKAAAAAPKPGTRRPADHRNKTKGEGESQQEQVTLDGQSVGTGADAMTVTPAEGCQQHQEAGADATAATTEDDAQAKKVKLG